MTRLVRAGAAALVLLAVLASPLSASSEDARFAQLTQEFFDHWFRHSPQVATRLGVHAFDDRLEPVTQATLEEDTGWYRGFRNRLARVPRERLSFDRQLERDVLAARVERELFDLEVIRPWQTNPNSYLELIASSVQSLLQRDFAAPCSRVRSAAKRLARVPEVLRAAKINLVNPPRLYTEVAISQFQGALKFYRETVPQLGASCRDPRSQADLAEADSSAVHAVEDFVAWMRDDLLARSNGNFALGQEVYQRKLACDELEDMPVDTILARASFALDTTQARIEALAEKIAPGLGVHAALDSLNRETPAENVLVPTVAGQLEKIRDFLRGRDLITLPEREHLIVRFTPVFRRSLSFASMESPGVWEQRANEAYYNVTPPDSSWSEAQKRDHLAFFNRWSSEIVSIHEALPGHYYQFLALRKVPSRIRQSLGCGTNSEGWAHYCEQMALEQGYGGGDPRYALAQALAAQQRLGRTVAGISLHTRGWTIDQAEQLFEQRCFMPRVQAEREARRGALDPTYLVYTLGKWRILELRDEVMNKLGPRFRLKDFHDAFLRQGCSPLSVVRAGLLHDLEQHPLRPSDSTR